MKMTVGNTPQSLSCQTGIRFSLFLHHRVERDNLSGNLGIARVTAEATIRA